MPPVAGVCLSDEEIAPPEDIPLDDATAAAVPGCNGAGRATAAQATTVPTGEQSGTSCGEDWFRISLPAAVGLRVTLTFDQAESDLDLYGYAAADPTRPIEVADGVDDTEIMNLGPFAEATDVLVRIHNAGGLAAAFKLTMDHVAPAPNDACEAALVLAAGQSVEGNTGGAVDTVRFNGRDCTGYHDQGRDVFYTVTVPAGRTLTVHVASDDDLALYLVDSCETRCCWAGVDEMNQESEETLSYENATGTDQTLVLGVDAWGKAVAGAFALSVDIQ